MIGLRVFGFFFFQAEDGIRDHCVTGVQTCALPISASGFFVTAGAFCTLSVAGSVEVLPSELVKVARYSSPLWEAFAAVIVSVVLVASLTVPHVLPPFPETSHLTVAAGLALAAASKVAFSPSVTVTL